MDRAPMLGLSSCMASEASNKVAWMQEKISLVVVAKRPEDGKEER